VITFVGMLATDAPSAGALAWFADPLQHMAE
jgi:hypothetical protein